MTNTTPAANRRPFGHHDMVAFFYDEKNALQNERESLCVGFRVSVQKKEVVVVCAFFVV